MKMEIEPVRSFSADEIKNIRTANNLTQLNFATALGVSKKAVEAWESGRNIPNGSVCRLLSMLEKDPRLFKKYCMITKTV